MLQTSLTSWLKRKDPMESPVKPESTVPTTKAPETVDAPQEAHVEHDIQEVNGSRTINGTPESSTQGGQTVPHNLVSNITISPVTKDTLTPFRRVITLLLPVPYSDKFFKEILTDEIVSSLTLIAFWSDTPTSNPRVVSGIRCRLLARSPTLPQQPSSALSFFQSTPATPATSEADEKPSLYVSTIATLAPYRSHGIAGTLLRQVTARAIEDYGVATVTAHVWEANEEARAWYAKLGFVEVSLEPEYYKRLRPMGAWLLERKVCPSDLLAEKGRTETAVG
jgi:ribosomal protein S18 acetylase RimI-like enzyme